MKQKDFEKLVASIKEAGEIKAGHKEPKPGVRNQAA